MKTLYSLFLILILFVFPLLTKASFLPYKLKGKFLLDTDKSGEIFYVDQKIHTRHKISNLRDLAPLAIGISNADILKIPIAIDERLIFIDSDEDGLDDLLEIAIGSDPFNPDTDGDSYSDLIELKYHFNPLGSGRLNIDLGFSQKLAGQILIQVEGRGELWYVNPVDKLRYYLPNEEYFRKTMSYIALGISELNLEQIVDNAQIKEGMTKSFKIDVGQAQTLSYYLDDIKLGSFLISSGKASTPTPLGNYQIINKHPKAWSPFGLWMPYWLGLGTGRFGLHELPIWPSGYREGENHLGIAVSAGCIRLGIGPAEFIYNFSHVGMAVEIVKD
jgi:hypothetical protein